jgi:hypothetical protein
MERGSWIRFASRVGVVALVSALAGCGSGSVKGVVTGRVLLDGKPLPGGTITFRPDNSKEPPAFAEFDSQGRFEVTVASGECKIMVDNRGLAPRAENSLKDKLPPGFPPLPPEGQKNLEKLKKGGGATGITPEKRDGTYVEIPKKYYDIATSGLTYTVKPGSQEHDVELTRK